MEAAGACRLYERSLVRHKMRYIPFVGDGDSKSHASVTRSEPYGPGVFIPKEDCIGHVTKRMGTALRKLQANYKGNCLKKQKLSFVTSKVLLHEVLVVKSPLSCISPAKQLVSNKASAVIYIP